MRRNPDHIIAVYIVANRRNGTIYTGVTGDLSRRVYEHREGLLQGFTRTYACKTLVWYERHDLVTNAIQREKRLKKYPRASKINLIESANPHWVDLYNLINNYGPPPPRRCPARPGDPAQRLSAAAADRLRDGWAAQGGPRRKRGTSHAASRP